MRSFWWMQLTIPILVVLGPYLKYAFTSFKVKEESFCWVFIFDFISYIKLFLWIKLLNDIIFYFF